MPILIALAMIEYFINEAISQAALVAFVDRAKGFSPKAAMGCIEPTLDPHPMKRSCLLLAFVLIVACCGSPAAQAHPAFHCPPDAAPADCTAAPRRLAGDFIRAAGAQLTLGGRPVLLKGVNYYPQWRPWSVMWRDWDAPQTARELRAAREDLGINVVRVLLPYNFSGKKNGGGQLPPVLVARLREFIQIAGRLDMRVLITLFDFSHDFPAANTPLETQQLDYLRALIPQFAGDDRVFAWDVHNEPDQYEVWRDGDQAAVLGWLGRVADLVHQLAPRQLVTVGMSIHSNLWLPGPDGRRPIDYTDVVSMHTYDAGAVGRQLDELRAHTAKPILVEEFGWPTRPPCVENYTEATQADLYRVVVDAARSRSAGVLAWTLRDFDAARTVRWDSREEYFGLYRADGSLKPAARTLQALAAPPLPSATHTSMPLSSSNPRLPDDPRSALLIPGTTHYVKGEFRRAWELLGGAGSFGLPLTDAFKRPSDGVVVQYFTSAVLEYHPELAGDSKITPEIDQLKRVLRPVELGSAYAQGRALPPPAPSLSSAFRDLYARINGEWRLGRPISTELPELVEGVPMRVQYFQTGRLELRITSSTATVGALGQSAWDAQCGAAP